MKKINYTEMDEGKILFRAAVNFSHSIIWFIVICVMVAAFYFTLPPLIESFSGDFVLPSVFDLSTISLAIGVSLPILLLVIKLKIQVRSDGICLKIIPFQFSFRKIPWKGLISYESYQLNSSGTSMLGLRNVISGKAYALGGRRGIKLGFEDGKTIYIETRKPERIIEAIKNAIAT